LDLTKIKNDILDIRIFCGRYFPFVVIPLSYARITASEQVPTAGVDEKGRMAINQAWWSTLYVESKRYVMIHEVLHIALCHPFRAKGFDHDAYNFASDGKVNHAITEANISGIDFKNDGLVTLNTIATVTKLRVEDLDKMSTEEIVRLLENKANQSQCSDIQREEQSQSGNKDSFGDDLLRGEANGTTVQEGDAIVAPTGSTEDLKRTWKQLCQKSKAFAKQAGTMPASLERVVNEILEVRPPWQTTVRFGLRNSSTADSSFAYPNRRNDELPGPLGYSKTVFCLIDTSGSISEEELSCFLGIVKYESRNASLRVISWDAQAYEVLKAERPREVASKIAAKMKGGGGTVCLPVLQRVHKIMNIGDAVLMLSDGDIFDADKSETQDWFKKVAAKAGFAMIGYTHKPVEAPGFSSAPVQANQTIVTGAV